MEKYLNIGWFWDSLQVMLYGMAGIFIVIGLIASVVFLMNRVFRKR